MHASMFCIVHVSYFVILILIARICTYRVNVGKLQTCSVGTDHGYGYGYETMGMGTGTGTRP